MEKDHTGVEALEMVVIEDRIGFMENKTIWKNETTPTKP
jgi:hypothetical protein